MKAQMHTNLIAKYQQSKELDGELYYLFKNNWLEYTKTKLFLKSIEGKIVDLVFIGGDAFEKNDNNYWLPESLWRKI